MPIYEYQAEKPDRSCAHCRRSFEALRQLSAPPLTACPQCGAPVVKLISPSTVGASRSGFDARAKHAGFHKLQRRGKGEYEKAY